MALKNQTKVSTPLGIGYVIGRDPHFNEFRYIVKIEKWTKEWSLSELHNPCFWPHEVEEVL